METRHVGFGNVVALFRGRPAVTFPAVAQVDAYWEALRRGRPMPDRAEVDPRGIGGALEFAFLMEQVAPGIGRIRISGMHLRDLLGMEVRGMPLTAFFLPEARDRISKALHRVVSVPEVADISLSSPPGIGRPELQARMILAPLATADRGVPRILGCLESHGDPGRSPRRFRIDHVQMRRIVATSAEPAPVMPPLRPAAREPMPGMAEPGAPFAGRDAVKPGRPPGRAHLRLIKNDD